ncbi:MAG TPA: sodium/proline symporter [Thermoanaerobaculia bacterium]|nr:sodium/proline symporter [Thermoanaerobaculia bacterium]
MSRPLAILITLLCYLAALIGIGVWASRRTHDDGDFFLGGRRLGAWVAALSASASSSSAWTLLGVSGAAWAWGLSALWLFPATVSGFLINWLWVAPRLMEKSRADGSLTLTEFIAGDRQHPLHTTIVRVASVAILVSFLFYIASQFQAAGHAFSSAFGMSVNASIAVGAVVIVAYTLLGGFWAVSVTDMLQGLLMAASALFLPLVALVAVGGPGALVAGLQEMAPTGALSLTRNLGGWMAVAFVLGTLGIGLGYPGQPHVVNRFMALRDVGALRRGRLIAIGWAVVIYAGMLLLGLCGRVLWPGVPDGEQILFETATRLLSPVLAGIVIAAVLSAIMSTADSQLLVASSSISWDWRRGVAGGPERRGLALTRAVVLIVSLVAMALAVFAPAAIFSRVLFAWHALGSAFGPVLVVRLAGYAIDSRAVLGSIVAGFGLTVVLYLMPDAPGDAAERLIPLMVALAIAWAGRRRA